MEDIDITQLIANTLDHKSFIFNPSIAHLSGDIYLLSVRSYLNDYKEPMDITLNFSLNSQHPWTGEWKGDIDNTSILPVLITGHTMSIITKKPLIELPIQDMRLFRFITDGQKVIFIVTFNKAYDGKSEMVIKGGDFCDDWCFIIGWAYLIVDIETLEYSYIPGAKPLCMNISSQVEKNWSLWKIVEDNIIHLLISYALTPIHTAFSMIINGIENSEMIGGSDCRMVTPRPGKGDNIFGQLEKFYNNKVYASLSTPSYLISNNEYQGVGHLKININYIKNSIKNGLKTPLTKFARRCITEVNWKYFHPQFIYMMFIYRFKLKYTDEKENPKIVGSIINLTNSSKRIRADITHVSPAFIIKTLSQTHEYMLNFPAGQVINEKETIISYGNGDAFAHLLFFPNNEIEELLVPVSNLSPQKFLFMRYIIN